ncbi:hypothetical protein ACG9XR_09640 [Acinetobacter guillouiae]|uniref:hypothetical protein n=1 Tax=Acinetobacter guillouiae TaxID=106649 RepID=UPI0028D0B6BA|nr:hypothetical protein [Acinetobacter guillouiae]
MIKVSTHPATDSYPIKKVVFMNSNDFEFRTIHFDKDDNFIYESFTDIDCINKSTVTYIFSGSDYKLVGYRKHSSEKSEDYLWIDDEFKLMSTELTEVICNFEGIKISNFDMNGDLFYYRIVNSKLIKTQTYNSNDEEIYMCEDLQNEYHRTLNNLIWDLESKHF